MYESRRGQRGAPSLVLLALMAVASLPVTAQMPSAPVLQNAWANAGVTLAANYGSTADTKTFAGAIAWAPKQSRFQLSAGGGAIRGDSGVTKGGYGARLSIPLVEFASGRLGTAAFGGVGFSGGSALRRSSFPIGVAVGYRHGLGATRAVSAYIAPFYLLSRLKGDSVLKENGTRGVFRASVGVDVTIAPQFGATIGYEAGAKATGVEPGPRGGVFGIALSYALRRQE